MEAFVTEEDTKGLRKAHKRADRIIEHAADVALIASFHYKKKNFHLVKLLEPIFIIGSRIDDIKGYYFTLLDDATGAKVVPILEDLLAKRDSTPPPDTTNLGSKGKGGGRENKAHESEPTTRQPQSGRRSWRNRGQAK